MKNKLTAVIVGSMMSGMVVANEGNIKMGIDMDLSYVYSDNYQTALTGAAGTPGIQYIPGTALSNERNDFDVNMAAVTLSGSSKDLDWLIEADLAGEDGLTGSYINQAWLKMNVSEMFTVTAGRMYSFFGFEGTKAKDNWNYLRSYGWQLAPSWHNGVALNWDMKNGFTAGLHLLDESKEDNDTNTTDARDNAYAVGATVGYSMDKLTTKFDFYRSKEGTYAEALTQYNLNATYDINDRFAAAAVIGMGKGDIAAEGSESKYTNYAAYLKFKATEQFYAALRYEIYEEEVTGTGSYFITTLTRGFDVADLAGQNSNQFNSATITGGYDLMNGSELKLDLRMDSADRKVWLDGGDSTKEKKDSVNVVALAWLYRY